MLAALLGLLLGGCGRPVPKAANPTPVPIPVNAIPVGAFLPLSGSQEAFGQAAVEGIKLAVSQINSGGGA